MPATGAPMRVHDRTVIRTGTQQVATGHDEVRDSSGNLIATQTHYENQQVSWEEREWYPIQGRSRLDDESFYRIAGDNEAAAQYEAWHHGGVTRNTIGWIMLGVGLAVLGGGAGMYIADADTTDTAGNPTHTRGAISTVGYVGMSAGILAAGIGGVLIYAGKHAAAARDARLIDDPDRMKADAERYNQTLMNAQPQQQVQVPVVQNVAPTAPPGQPIPLAPFAATMTKDRFKRVELKADGGVWADGRQVAILSGSDVKDPSGTTMFSIFADGSISGTAVPAGKVRIANDQVDLGEKRITVADDGTIVIVSSRGVETVGRITQGARNKRAITLTLFAVAILLH